MKIWRQLQLNIAETFAEIQTYSMYDFLQSGKKKTIRIWYNPIPHLTQDTIWESDKTQEK